MNLFESVSAFIAVFFIMIVATLWLRQQDILSTQHAPIISKMIMNLVYPALIFSHVARSDLTWNHLQIAGSIDIALLIIGLVLFMLGRFVFRLDRPSMAAFMLAGTFSGTSLLGASFLNVVYADHPEMVSLGVVIAQFSHGLLINTVGIFIAINYGTSGMNTTFALQAKEFISSKPILALLAGVLWNISGLPVTGYFPLILFTGLTTIGAALPFLAAVVTGLAFEPIKIKNNLPLLCVVALSQFVAQPLISDYFVGFIDVPGMERDVGLMMSALPSAPLAVIICTRYGCNAQLASTMVLFTCILSIFTLPLTAFFA